MLSLDKLADCFFRHLTLPIIASGASINNTLVAAVCAGIAPTELHPPLAAASAEGVAITTTTTVTGVCVRGMVVSVGSAVYVGEGVSVGTGVWVAGAVGTSVCIGVGIIVGVEVAVGIGVCVLARIHRSTLRRAGTGQGE